MQFRNRNEPRVPVKRLFTEVAIQIRGFIGISRSHSKRRGNGWNGQNYYVRVYYITKNTIQRQCINRWDTPVFIPVPTPLSRSLTDDTIKNNKRPFDLFSRLIRSTFFRIIYISSSRFEWNSLVRTYILKRWNVRKKYYSFIQHIKFIDDEV